MGPARRRETRKGVRDAGPQGKVMLTWRESLDQGNGAFLLCA